jgi:hypothetical protein
MEPLLLEHGRITEVDVAYIGAVPSEAWASAAIEYAAVRDYPVDGCEPSRRLLGRELRGQEDFPFVQGEVRATLRKFGCPKTSDSPRANWVADEEMAKRVAAEVRRPLQQWRARA